MPSAIANVVVTGCPRGVKPTPEGTIQIAFTWNGLPCRERLKLKPTQANIKYAERLRAAIVSEIERGSFDYARHFPESTRSALHGGKPVKMVGDLLDEYLIWAKGSVAWSTYKGYESAVRHHLQPTFGETPITDLTVSEIKAWLGGLEITAKRINNVLIPLRHVTADAHSDGLIPADPMKRIQHLKDRRPKQEPDPFTVDEVQALIAAARDLEVAVFIQFACSTGMRTSELMALRWGDIDRKQGTVRVRRAFVEGKLSEATKTASGTRDVLLMPMALDALKFMKPITSMKQDEIFCYPFQCRPFEGYDEIRKCWSPTIKRAGIRYRPQYQTRHTYASWMLSAGENPVWLAQQMGHSDWGMLRRVYGRWIDSAAPGAGERGRLLFGGNAGLGSVQGVDRDNGGRR